MLAVTIGVGEPYAEMARLAAERVARFTGLETAVLGDDAFGRFGGAACRFPHWLKFHLFALFPEEEDILYFDADLVFLAPWTPQAYAGGEALVAVRDLWYTGCVQDDCREFGLDPHGYFNSGLVVMNRRQHTAWLARAHEVVQHLSTARFIDQTALNIARAELDVPIRFLDRRHNWIRYGEGDLCRQVKVRVAHAMKPDDRKGTTLQVLRGTLQVPAGRQKRLRVSEAHFAALGGRRCIYKRVGHGTRVMTLREDGTIGRGSAGLERFWFVHERSDGTPVLAIGDQQSVICELVLHADGVWRGRWNRFEKMPIELFEHRSQVVLDRLAQRAPEGADRRGLRGAEIGVYQAETSELLLEGERRLHLLCVDPWRAAAAGSTWAAGGGSLAAKSQRDLDAARRRALERLARFPDRHEVVREAAETAHRDVADGSLDFVFVDGDHSYEGTRVAIERWWPKVAPGGFMAGHDYAYPQDGNRFAVERAVEDALVGPLELRVETGPDYTWIVERR